MWEGNQSKKCKARVQKIWYLSYQKNEQAYKNVACHICASARIPRWVQIKDRWIPLRKDWHCFPVKSSVSRGNFMVRVQAKISPTAALRASAKSDPSEIQWGKNCRAQDQPCSKMNYSNELFWFFWFPLTHPNLEHWETFPAMGRKAATNAKCWSWQYTR